MNSFELETDEQSYVGSMFMARVANEIRRAAAIEKASRKITQQAIADKIGTSRAVVNREMQGLENLSARRTAELLWALGWEPYFEARKIPDGDNQCMQVESKIPLDSPAQTPPPKNANPSSEISGGLNILEMVEKAKGAPVPSI
jgi:hypothetical protein